MDDISNNTPTLQRIYQTAGGSATAGGIDFQAAITAYVSVFMARGRPLRWLARLVDDIPTAIEVETGGAGDDLRFFLKDGQTVEVQAKQGLRSGPDLWNTLIKLSKAVTTGDAYFGVLVVSNSSSNSIKIHLAKDIERIGDGCIDKFSDKGKEFLEKLDEQGISSRKACEHIRIVTIPAMTTEQEATVVVQSQLEHLCADITQINAAWCILYYDSMHLIAMRSRRDVSSLLRVLMSSGIMLAQTKTTASAILLAKLSRWTFDRHATFSIIGVDHPLNIDDAWIPLTAVVRAEEATEPSSLAEELKRYQTWEDRSISHNAHTVASETLGRFISRAVVVAGPGMGKTTLLKYIARRYSKDNIPVLYIKLSIVAAHMSHGDTFERAIFLHGLDGSGINVDDAQRANFPNWLLLCDGLDECGVLQTGVADGINCFSIGHPGCRILVTTRPVGFYATQFHDWQHYELPALDPWSAPTHTELLVEAITPPDSDLHGNAWEVCQRELNNTKAGKILGRTPLLLSLAAAIIARGMTLANTRERLFEQIFNLLDNPSNPRATEKPASSIELRFFLNSLGWEITNHPLRSISEIIIHCSIHLARETGVRSIAAAGNAERYLSYWEKVGIIERVGRDDRQTISFIHKSFGEFAAAQYLCSLRQDDQLRKLAKIVDDPTMTDVLRFAGMMGLANPVTFHLLTLTSLSVDVVKHITIAVELLSEADPPPDIEHRQHIIEEAFRVVTSNRRTYAFEVGLPLVAATRRFPDEVIPTAKPLVGDNYAWTRLIAWACLVAAGPNYYLIDDLMSELKNITDDISPSMKQSLGGGLILDFGSEHELAESFVLDACAAIIDNVKCEISDDIIPDILNHPSFGSTEFIFRARKLLQEKGKTYKIKKLEPIEHYAATSDDYLKERNFIYQVIFDALDLPIQISHDNIPCPNCLLYFSAFIESSMVDKIYYTGSLAWSQPFNNIAVRTTLQVFLTLSNIDLESLRTDAIYAKHLVDNSSGASDPLSGYIVNIDPPVVDWPQAKTLDIDVSIIEEAILHPSQWIKWLAANILENILGTKELECVIQRLFEIGKGFTLWAACGLAEKIERQRVVELILERMTKPPVWGCGYLFDLLCEGELPQKELLLATVRAGLLTDFLETAMAAARLAIKIAEPKFDNFASVLENAYEYWLLHEKPYPKRGIIPDSPRANIIKALTNIRLPSYKTITSFLKDSRHDVREIGAKVLVDRLRQTKGERLQFFKEIESGVLPCRVLETALRGELPLGEDEIAIVEHLLKNANEHIRYGAMALLTECYLDRNKIRKHATAMTFDSEQQIVDRAFSILDKG